MTSIREKMALYDGNIRDKALRVTFYARVSTSSSEQANSLENQVQHYEDYIKQYPNWVYVPGYIDRGLSGTSTAHRINFNRMMEDAAKDKFDLVITREISRFARNTLDSLKYTRDLKEKGIAVYFESYDLLTIGKESEFRLSLLSSVAQEESENTSKRVRSGHAQAVKNGVVLGNSRIFGYKKDAGKLVIDEEQAVFVRELFKLYASGQYSMKKLEEYFWEKGFRNTNGKKIAHGTMSEIISNPKYKGYYAGHKVMTTDMFTHKQIFFPQDEWILYKDETGNIVPAIVPEEVWDRANDVLKRRSDSVKNRQGICNHDNLLTGIMFCTACGTPYYRRDSVDKSGRKNSCWVCSGKIKNGKNSCQSLPIYETEIKPIIAKVFSNTEAERERFRDEYIEMIKKIRSEGSIQGEVDRITEEVKKIDSDKRTLVRLLTTGVIDDADFKFQNDDLNAEKKDKERRIRSLQQEQESDADFERRIREVEKALESAESDVDGDSIDKEFVANYIERIDVTPIDGKNISLDIEIKTGDKCRETLKKIKNRAEYHNNGIPEEEKVVQAASSKR